jgi:hypothetical protein
LESCRRPTEEEYNTKEHGWDLEAVLDDIKLSKERIGP